MTYDEAKRVYFVRIRSYMFLAANPSKEVFSSILGMSFSLISILFYGFLENLTLMQIKIPQLTEVFIILKLIFMKLIFFGKYCYCLFFGTPLFLTHEEDDGITDPSPILIKYFSRASSDL